MNDLPPRVRPLLRIRAFVCILIAGLGGVLPDIDHIQFIEQAVGPRGLHVAFGVLALFLIGVALASLFGLFHKHGVVEVGIS